VSVVLCNNTTHCNPLDQCLEKTNTHTHRKRNTHVSSRKVQVHTDQHPISTACARMQILPFQDMLQLSQVTVTDERRRTAEQTSNDKKPPRKKKINDEQISSSAVKAEQSFHCSEVKLVTLLTNALIRTSHVNIQILPNYSRSHICPFRRPRPPVRACGGVCASTSVCSLCSSSVRECAG